MDFSDEEDDFDINEYKKVVKTQSQNIVKLQKYRDQEVSAPLASCSPDNGGNRYE